MEDTCYINHHPDKNTPGYEWDCQCARCGSSVIGEPCDNCGGEGVCGHDCGEDCCCCMYPEDNVPCDECGGDGMYYVCMSTQDFCKNNPLPGREHIERRAIEWFEVKIMNPDGN